MTANKADISDKKLSSGNYYIPLNDGNITNGSIMYKINITEESIPGTDLTL